MEKKDLLEKIKELTKKEITLTDISQALKINEYEVLSLIRELRLVGTNIITQMRDDGIYMYNQGEKDLTEDNTYQFFTDENQEFKFVAISDIRFGSKYQQLSILNDIYLKANKLGFENVIICGNITEGLYSLHDKYAKTNFLDDSLKQVDYIANYFPSVEGIKTYFITGSKDEKHLQYNKINIGKRIEQARSDMVYLGHGSCNIKIDKAKMLAFSPNLVKTYTVSYRPQQQLESFRSEDKPDILLYGGLLQMEKFTDRNITCISVPSACATTREMNDKRHSNTIGTWYITVTTDKYGNFKSIKAMDSVYYQTNKDDYLKPKVLKLTKNYDQEG